MKSAVAPAHNSTASSGGSPRGGEGSAYPAGGQGASGAAASRTARASGPRISRRELVDMTSQLAIMARAGVDVATALKSLARQCHRPALQQVLHNVQADVMGGRAVSEALGKYRHVFGGSYIASVAAGEASGRLPEVLEQLADLERTALRMQSTLRTLLAYPILLASVSGLVVLGLVLFVLPQFADIFAQFETPLPAITQILINVSVELRSRYWLWGGLLLAAIAGVMIGRRSDAGRRTCDRLVLNLVVVRNITRSLLLGRTCRLLGMMIESGVPLLECLRLARQAVNNSCYQELFAELEQEVMNGRGLGNSLLHCPFIPSSAAEMVVTAERTGTLALVTRLIGEHYEEEGETRLREVVTLLEPAITVGMGAVVAFVVLAVMLPMFDLATFAQ